MNKYFYIISNNVYKRLISDVKKHCSLQVYSNCYILAEQYISLHNIQSEDKIECDDLPIYSINGIDTIPKNEMEEVLLKEALNE